MSEIETDEEIVKIDEERVRENELRMETLTRFLDHASTGIEASAEYNESRDMVYITARPEGWNPMVGYVSGFNVITVDFQEEEVKFAPTYENWEEIKDV